MDKHIITDVNPNFWWPKVSGYLLEVIKDHPGYDEDSVVTLLQAKVLRLHIIRDTQICGALVTILQEYPLCRELFIIFGGGKELDFNQLDEYFGEYAKKLECSIISFWGRRGWVKRYKKYDTQYSVFMKRI